MVLAILAIHRVIRNLGLIFFASDLAQSRRHYEDTTKTLRRHYEDTTETLQRHYRDTADQTRKKYPTDARSGVAAEAEEHKDQPPPTPHPARVGRRRREGTGSRQPTVKCFVLMKKVDLIISDCLRSAKDFRHGE